MIRYFDAGAYKGEIIDEIIKLANKAGCDYQVYAFEPANEANKELHKKYGDNKKVTIYKLALTNKTVDGVPLYHSKNADGYSLCKTKWNVNPEDFEQVSTEKLSVFLNSIPKDKGEFWVLKVNVEGSEYELFKDLIESKAHAQFDLVIGTLGDLRKLKDKSPEEADKFEAYVKKNLRFVEVTPRKLEGLKEVETAFKNLSKSSPKPSKVSKVEDFDDDLLPEPKGREGIESVVAKMPEKQTKVKRTITKKVKEVKR
jgi:FkbM family methyltransferase